MAFSVGQSISRILNPKLTCLKSIGAVKASIVKPIFSTQSQIFDATNLPYNHLQMRSQHVLTSARLISLVPVSMRRPLLQAVAPTLSQSCGLKHNVDSLRKRCKDCNFVFKSGIKHVICHTHPRHNQRARIPKPKELWILSGVCTAPRRPW